MLFNSFPFIFAFLPIALVGYHALGWIRGGAPIVWLALASVAFYAVGGWQFVPLLLASVLFNYAIGLLLIYRPWPAAVRALLAAGIGCDLLVLFYFKYAGFFVANINAIFSTSLTVNVLLPVGISFYTFTQIAFLVDAYRRDVLQCGLPSYALFVTYFPHLIAGPIIHHRDVIPQLERAGSRRVDPHLILCGLIFFSIGLFKKTFLADGIQPYVVLAFGPDVPSFYLAWIGALAYTFQLYFDFSGYSDMAIGISLMFGVFLPLNFNSPYKSSSIIDFWRRWHITLSQFLRDYLYIPLGGNRRGRLLRYVNLMITMGFGGLWHGAAWTFFAWGVLHGIYLSINHLWNALRPSTPLHACRLNVVAFALTFLSVVVAWVFFRANDMASALTILSKMAKPSHTSLSYREMFAAAMIGAYSLLVWLGPNTQTIMGYDHRNRRVGEGLMSRYPRTLPCLAAGGLALAILGIAQHSEFIYFRF